MFVSLLFCWFFVLTGVHVFKTPCVQHCVENNILSAVYHNLYHCFAERLVFCIFNVIMGFKALIIEINLYICLITSNSCRISSRSLVEKLSHISYVSRNNNWVADRRDMTLDFKVGVKPPTNKTNKLQYSVLAKRPGNSNVTYELQNEK